MSASQHTLPLTGPGFLPLVASPPGCSSGAHRYRLDNADYLVCQDCHVLWGLTWTRDSDDNASLLRSSGVPKELQLEIRSAQSP